MNFPVVRLRFSGRCKTFRPCPHVNIPDDGALVGADVLNEFGVSASDESSFFHCVEVCADGSGGASGAVCYPFLGGPCACSVVVGSVCECVEYG